MVWSVPRVSLGKREGRIWGGRKECGWVHFPLPAVRINCSQSVLGSCFLIILSLLNEWNSLGLKSYSLIVTLLGCFLPWRDSGNHYLWTFTSRRIFLCCAGRLSLRHRCRSTDNSPVVCCLKGSLWQRWVPGHREILFQILTDSALRWFWIVILMNFFMSFFSNFKFVPLLSKTFFFFP